MHAVIQLVGLLCPAASSAFADRVVSFELRRTTQRCELQSEVHGTSWLEETQRKTTTDITWVLTVETDLRPANVGLHTSWHRAQDHID